MEQRKVTPARKARPEDEAPAEAKNLQNDALGDDIDDLLEEIDAVIGEVGEEFALQFVQQGGQ